MIEGRDVVLHDTLRPNGVSRPVGVLTQPSCPNCESQLVAAFCAQCGERQPSGTDFSTRHLALEAVNELLNVDGRLWRSIVGLLSKPGLLTAEYFAGRRGRYMRPFSLFVLLNVAFFFVQPYTGLLRYSYEMYVGSDGRAAMAKAKQTDLALSTPRFEQRFDDELRDQKKSLLLVAVPVFALALLVLYARSGRVYVEHLVFSVHAYAFILFYFTALSALGFGLLRVIYTLLPLTRPFIGGVMSGEGGLLFILAAGLLPYLTIALRRFYRSSLLTSALRAVVLFFVFESLILVFRNILFHTTLLAL